MRKIANTVELQSELQQILDYAGSERPSRVRLAAALEALSQRVAFSPPPGGYKDFILETGSGNDREYEGGADTLSDAKAKAKKIAKKKDTTVFVNEKSSKSAAGRNVLVARVYPDGTVEDA